jgi:hypothetical protein
VMVKLEAERAQPLQDRPGDQHADLNILNMQQLLAELISDFQQKRQEQPSNTETTAHVRAAAAANLLEAQLQHVSTDYHITRRQQQQQQQQ